MQTYVCILRGINVSGQKLIKMEELRKGFESVGLQDVRTYIQSGNIIFQSKVSAKLEETIHQMILKKFGYEVPVIIRTPDQLVEVRDQNPYQTQDPKTLYVCFLSEIPDSDHVEELKEVVPETEYFEFNGSKEVYMHFPNGFGKAKLNNNFIEKKLKVTATSRNWNTLNKLISLSES